MIVQYKAERIQFQGFTAVEKVLALCYLSSPTGDGMGYHRILTTFFFLFIISSFEANGEYEWSGFIWYPTNSSRCIWNESNSFIFTIFTKRLAHRQAPGEMTSNSCHRQIWAYTPSLAELVHSTTADSNQVAVKYRIALTILSRSLAQRICYQKFHQNFSSGNTPICNVHLQILDELKRSQISTNTWYGFLILWTVGMRCGKSMYDAWLRDCISESDCMVEPDF